MKIKNWKLKIPSSVTTNKNFVVFLLIFSLVFGAALPARAFLGPSSGQNPGAGSGAFTIDPSRNIGFGTGDGTPSAAPPEEGTFGKIFTIASSTNPGIALKNLSGGGRNYVLFSRNNGRFALWDVTARAVRLVVHTNGNIGIASSTPATEKLHVFGNIKADGSFVGALSGSLSAANVTGPSAFGTNYGTYNYAFPGALAVGTSTIVGLPANGFVVMGNVGIGTTGPVGTLEVAGSIHSSGSATASKAGQFFMDYIGGSGRLLALGPDAATRAGFALALTKGDGSGYIVPIQIDTDGNVGIGTSTPGRALDVVGSARFTSNTEIDAPGQANFIIDAGGTSGGNDQSSLIYRNQGANKAVIQYKLASDALQFTFGGGVGTERMRIESGGNVGIATTTPQYKLDVVGGGRFSQPVFVGAPSVDGHATTKSYVDSVVGGGSGSGNFSTLTVSGTTTLATANGRVGIGTTSPASALDLSTGVLTIDGGAQEGHIQVGGGFRWLGLKTRSNGYSYLIGDDASENFELSIYDEVGATYKWGVFQIEPSATTDSLVLSGGNVGIGTTGPIALLDVVSGGTPEMYIRSTAGSSKDAILHIRGARTTSLSSQLARISFENVAGGAGSAGLEIARITGDNDDGVDNTSLGKLTFYTTDSGEVLQERMRIDTSGNIGIATTTPAYKLSVVGTASFSQPVIVGTPTGDSHAATKSYVDSTVSAGDADWAAVGGGDPTLAGDIYHTGKIGIGTTGPGSLLHVSGNPGANTALLTITHTANAGNNEMLALDNDFTRDVGISLRRQGTQQWSIRNDGATGDGDKLIFKAGTTAAGTDVVAIQQDGNVGIGTTNPSQKLHLSGSGPTTVLIQSTDNNPVLKLQPGGAAVDPRIEFLNGAGTRVASLQGSGTGQLILATDTNWPITFRINSIEKARIDTSGNVGIGTTEPSELLHVHGGTVVSDPATFLIQSNVEVNTNLGDVYAGIDLGVSGGENSLGAQEISAYIRAIDTRSGLTSYEDAGLAFGTMGTADAGPQTRMVIDSIGNVGIGTTGPTYKLDVAGTARFSQPVIVGTPTSDPHAATKSYVDSTVSTGDGDFAAVGGGDPTLAGDVYHLGNIGIGTSTSPSATLMVQANNSVQGLIVRAPASPTINLYRAEDSTGQYRWRVDQFFDMYMTNSGGMDTMVIKNSGNVGIGTTNPDFGLHLVGAFKQESVNPTYFLKETDVVDKNWDIQVNSGDLRFMEVNDARSVFNTRMIILDGGNVGIGTTGPGNWLHINNTRDTTASPNSVGLTLESSVSTNQKYQLGVGVSGVSNQYFSLRDVTAGVYRLVVTTGGNVGIGTTNPLRRLAVSPVSSISADMMTGRIENLGPPVNDTDAATRSYVDSTVTSGDNDFAAVGGGDPTLAGDVYHLGKIGIGTTNPAVPLAFADSEVTKIQLNGAAANGYLIGKAAAVNGADSMMKFTAGATAAGEFGFYGSGATPAVLINANTGNVGIGTASPATKLHIGGAPDSKVITIDQNGRQSAIGTFFSSGATLSRIDFFISDGGTGGTNNNRMSILGSGNVGIGTTGPLVRLDVRGSVLASDIILGSASVNNYDYIDYADGGISGLNTVGVFHFQADKALGQSVTSPSAGISVEGINNVGIIDMNSNRIINLGTPLNPDEAATRNYVDSTVSAGDADWAAVGGGDPSLSGDIYHTGSIGIGTTEPRAKLDVAGVSNVVTAIKTDGYIEDVSGLLTRNYVSSHSWNIGSGSVGIFGQNGGTAENIREWGIGPYGNRAILWKAVPDSTSNADGGWNTSLFPIDHTKTYRYTVWIKKTGSTNGTTYLGVYGSNLLNLSGTANSNPYFWAGDLPQLDKWYLLVGYVHGSGDASTVSYGGIYDGETGEKVINMTDYKHSTAATLQRHRSYLYYDTTTSDRQYWWDPRAEEVNGSEPSIAALLGQGASGQWAASGSDIYNTNSGNVGIGTAGPLVRLDVRGSVLASDIILGSASVNNYDYIDYADGGISGLNTVGVFHFQADKALGQSVTSPSAGISVEGINNVGIIDMNSNRIINLGTPLNPDEAATRNYVDSASVGNTTSCDADATCEMQGADLQGGNITGVNKITVNTIDPIYEINNKKYATYVASIVGGVKEEYVGRGQLSRSGITRIATRNDAEAYEYVIDFSRVEEGSDLWVWYKTVDFSRDNIEVLATPYGVPAPIAYEVDGNKITFRATLTPNSSFLIPDSIEFSYRLVGKRFDWRDHPTYVEDQDTPAGLKVE